MATIKDLDYICMTALWLGICDKHYVNGKLERVDCLDCSHLTLCNMVMISRNMLQSQIMY